MNKREIFETTARHLFAQGKQSVGTVSGASVCKYRGQNGLKCAVGIHITDEEYTSKIEGKAVGYIYKYLPEFSSRYSKIGVEFFRDLQIVHDSPSNWTTTEAMRKALLSVAKVYKIPYAKLLSSLSFADVKE